LDSALDDHGAVDLIGDTIDLLDVVGVRDDLVSGKNVLWQVGSVSEAVPLLARHTSPIQAGDERAASSPAKLRCCLAGNHPGGADACV